MGESCAFRLTSAFAPPQWQRSVTHARLAVGISLLEVLSCNSNHSRRSMMLLSPLGRPPLWVSGLPALSL